MKTVPPVIRRKRITCPWLWLLGLVIIVLACLWVRERQRLNADGSLTPVHAATIGELIREGEEPAPGLITLARRFLMSQMGPPTFHDPFGNFVYLDSRWLGLAPLPGGVRTPGLGVTVLVFNRDGSPCRIVGLNTDHGFGHNEMQVKDGDIPLVITCAVLLLLAALWLRWEWRNRERAAAQALVAQ